MNIQRIDIHHPLYQQERELRNRILLRPVGVPDYGWEMHDKESWHFIALKNDKVVGCVVLVPLNDKKNKVQLIQMAVDKPYQRKGAGKLLIKEILKFSAVHSVKEILIHSRANVVSFYEQFGFKVFGEAFEEVGISHRLMQRFI